MPDLEAHMGKSLRKRALTEEEVDRRKRRIYDYGMPVDRFMSQRIGAADRHGKQSEVRGRQR